MGAVGEAGGVFCILTEDEVLLAGPNTQKEREHQIRMTSLGESKALLLLQEPIVCWYPVASLVFRGWKTETA